MDKHDQSGAGHRARRPDSTALTGLRTSAAAQLAVLLAMALGAGSPAAVAAVDTRAIGPWNVSFYNSGDSYRDSSGTLYTGAQNWDATEIADVLTMLNVWDARIDNDAPQRQMKLNVMWSSLGTNVLGNSNNSFRGDGTHAWTHVEYLWRQGDNFSNSYADAFIQFGVDATWHTGQSLPGTNEYDFRSVVCHELGHTLGFTDTYSDSTDRWSNIGVTAYDSFLRDAQTGGNHPVAGSRGQPYDFVETADPVYFVGPIATAANGGNPITIYAPDPYEDGSSLAHLNDADWPYSLMKHSIYNHMTTRQPSALEWAMMKDLGWDIGILGDTDGSGVVDVNDLNNVYNHLGLQGYDLLGDTNGDGTVDVNDLNNVYNHLGMSSVGAQVPEPGSLVLLALGALALLRGRRENATRESTS